MCPGIHACCCDHPFTAYWLLPAQLQKPQLLGASSGLEGWVARTEGIFPIRTPAVHASGGSVQLCLLLAARGEREQLTRSLRS